MNAKLVVATANEGKLAEFRYALRNLQAEVLSASEAGISRFPTEKGVTYEENALLKAGYVATKTGFYALADDSGLEVDALLGAPGVHSARYGGNISDVERNFYLLDKLRYIPPEERGATFICKIVLATPRGYVVGFGGSCRGVILESPEGREGFGYDPIFFSSDLNKTFAEASLEEKDRVSHRGRALQAFVAWALTQDASQATVGDEAYAEPDLS